jgi:hypothetical protein
MRGMKDVYIQPPGLRRQGFDERGMAQFEVDQIAEGKKQPEKREPVGFGEISSARHSAAFLGTAYGEQNRQLGLLSDVVKVLEQERIQPNFNEIGTEAAGDRNLRGDGLGAGDGADNERTAV